MGTEFLIQEGSSARARLLLWSSDTKTAKRNNNEHEFAIDKRYEKEVGNKIEAFLNSKQHAKTHSVQFVMVTTNGIANNTHISDVNQQITLDDLFC